MWPQDRSSRHGSGYGSESVRWGIQLTEVWVKANARIRDLFNAEKQTRWAEMVGPPIQGTIQFPHPAKSKPGP